MKKHLHAKMQHILREANYTEIFELFPIAFILYQHSLALLTLNVLFADEHVQRCKVYPLWMCSCRYQINGAELLFSFLRVQFFLLSVHTLKMKRWAHFDLLV